MDVAGAAGQVVVRFGHEGRDDAVLHANGLGCQFEERGVVCHAEGVGVGERGFEDTGSGLGVVAFDLYTELGCLERFKLSVCSI